MNTQDQSILTTIYRIFIALTICGPIMALFISFPFGLPVVLTIALIANLIMSMKYYNELVRSSFDREIRKLLHFFSTSITILFLTSIPALITSYTVVNDMTATMDMIAVVIKFIGSIGAWGYYLVVLIKEYHQFEKMKKKKNNIFIA
jgi:hypothetical protein